MDPSTPANQISRKERERRQHEEEILQAARDLFARKGYYNTTLEEIAHHAQFGKGTIYNYFSSKEDLFFGILMGLLDTGIHIAEESMALSGTARDKLTAYAKAVLSYSEKNANLLQMVEREATQWNLLEDKSRLSSVQERIHKIWKTISIPLDEAVHAEQVKDLDTMHLAAIFDTLLRIHAMHPFRGLFLQQSVNSDMMAQFIVDFFFEGAQQRGKNQ
jgi:AcrR family transcriptional regulator